MCQKLVFWVIWLCIIIVIITFCFVYNRKLQSLSLNHESFIKSGHLCLVSLSMQTNLSGTDDVAEKKIFPEEVMSSNNIMSRYRYRNHD